MREVKIPCAYCGIVKPYPNDFPNSTYAQCNKCYEAECRKREAKKWKNRLLRFLKSIQGGKYNA